MKILAIDTSSKYLSIALSRGKDILGEESHLLDRRHSGELIPRIRSLLKKRAVSINAIDMFVVGLGPGSFTGLRIGVSTIKGFGIATGKPCIGIASIDALAMNTTPGPGSTLPGSGSGNGLIVPVIDAKRGNVYGAIYKDGVKKSKNLLISIDELMSKVKGEAVFLGDGISLYKDKILSYNKNVSFLGEEFWYPSAGDLIRLALKNIDKYKKIDLGKLKPIYLYPRDCQVRR